MHKALSSSFLTLNTIKVAMLAIFFLVIAFTGKVHAEPGAPPDTIASAPANPTDGASVLDPFSNGVDFETLGQFAALTFKVISNPATPSGAKVAIAIVLALILVVSGVRRFVPWPFLRTDAGSALAVLFLGVLGAFAHALAAGATFSWSLAGAGLAFGFAAAGGFATVVRILPWVIEKLPAPIAPVLGPVLRAVLAVIGSTRAKAEAKAAGDAAVKASPGTGVSGILSGK